MAVHFKAGKANSLKEIHKVRLLYHEAVEVLENTFSV